jgi:D-alanyl-D-alanine carboxypeptidase
MLPTAVLAAALVLLTGCLAPASPPTIPETLAAEASTASPPPPAGTSAQPVPGFDLTAFSTTDPASPWVIVNKTHPLDPVGYAPDDLVIVHDYYIRSIAADDLTALLDAAEADGVTLTLRSTYRSYAKQRTVYDGLVARNGQASTDRVSARPGYSEHQTGLAIDVGSSTDSACDFEACFATTAEGRWVSANAQRFGFIVRYTTDDEAVTGYSPEAWHLRHVGRPLATAMAATGVTTLEQMFDVDGGPDYH